MLEGPRPCTILCFNVHTKVEYLNRNVSIGQLLELISKSIVVCAWSRPKMLTKHTTKKLVWLHVHNRSPLLTLMSVSGHRMDCNLKKTRLTFFKFSPRFEKECTRTDHELFLSRSSLTTIFATRFQSYLMAIFPVIIPGLEIISANPLPIENGATGRQLILVQKSGTD